MKYQVCSTYTYPVRNKKIRKDTHGEPFNSRKIAEDYIQIIRIVNWKSWPVLRTYYIEEIGVI